MATSGSVDFSLTRNTLIRAAYRACGHETTDAAEYASAVEDLNMMLKHWQTLPNFKLWKRKECYVFLQSSTQSYSLGPTGDHATESYISAEVGTAYASGTTLVLDSTTGMTASDYIGVELDSGTREWATISSVDSGTNITLSGSLSGAAAAGNTVYTYTTKMERPLAIENPSLLYPDGREIPLNKVSRDEYMALPDKGDAGTVVEVYYQPTLTNGSLYVWPVTDDVDNIIRMTCLKQIEDVDAASDDFDLPQEWLRAIRWNLAAEFITQFGVPDPDAARIEARAARYLQDCMMWDAEDTSVQFT